MKKFLLGYSLFAVLALMFSSCGSLKTKGVAYESIRSNVHKSLPAPEGCEILVLYQIDKEGCLHATVNNLTDNIMIIDQTKSFFNTNGKSFCYFDPTVRTTTESNISSSTKGASVNLGAVGNALGVGGAIGSLLGGINVGGSGTSGTVQTNTTYIADQPQVGIAPHSSGLMSKSFPIDNVLLFNVDNIADININSVNLTPDESFCKFSVCITYSTDDGATFKKIVTDMYVNSLIFAPVNNYGMRNEAVNNIYKQKPDAINEEIWFMTSNDDKYYNSIVSNNGAIIDFQ